MIESKQQASVLRIQLFGQFALWLNHQPVHSFNAPRLQSFLAHLVLHAGVALSRQQLAFAFWPDTPDAQARNNLRQMLHQLRQALPNADIYLQVDVATVMWLDTAMFTVDVADFEAALDRAAAAQSVHNPSALRYELEKAVALYSDDLFPSCYDDWIAPERHRLHTRFVSALKQLVALLEQQRCIANAIPQAQRLFALDVLNEDHAANLMRLHLLNGDRTIALRVYRECAEALQNELSVEPGPALAEAHGRISALPQSAALPQRAVQDVPSPLIGRQPEWQQLQMLWQRAAQGQAQMVVLSGEAGIGKSRLAEELMVWARQQGFSVARTRAYAAEGRLSYAPVAEWLRSDSVWPALPKLDKIWRSEVARILPDLLTNDPDLPHPPAMTETTQRTRFFEALAKALHAAPQPLLLVLDDLQWCDQDTLEWLHYALRFDLAARLLIVGTMRPEEVEAKHPLMQMLVNLRQSDQLVEIDLKHLDAAESARLASHVLARPVELSEATQLYRDTEGNPLFIVEMARAGLGQGIKGGDEPNLRLPPRVQAVITARLAQLSDSAKDVMRLGAALGQAFRLDVLAQASDADDESLLRSLDELWQRRIVKAQDGDTYDFTHDKLREVAYAEVSPAMRRLLHRRTARAIEVVYASDLDAVSAQLAVQYERAGMVERAVAFYQRAAEVATRIFANNEVAELIGRGRRLIPKLTENVMRDELELRLVTTLSLTVIGSNDLRVAEQLDALERAQQLSMKLNQHLDPIILKALAINKLVQNDFQTTHQIGEQLIELGKTSEDSTLLLQGHQLLGIVHSWLGAFETARLHLQQAISYYDSQQSSAYISAYSWDPKVVSQCRLALDLWCLGYPDQALQVQQLSINLAQEIKHPFSLGYSLTWNLMLLLMVGDVAKALEQAEFVIEISNLHGMVWWLIYATVLHGCALGMNGQHAESANELEQGIAEMHSIGTRINQILPHGHLASAYAGLGQMDRGLDVLVNAIALCETQDRWYEADIHRIHGDMLLVIDPHKAEVAYLRAIAIAQTQSAKSFELRAAISLARLWKSQGKVAHALNLLRPLYDWFSEGFDTHDLKAAKALLDN